MARPLRVEFDGASYHVTSRGNARKDIFDEDGDRKAFLEILGMVVNRFGYVKGHEEISEIPRNQRY